MNSLESCKGAVRRRLSALPLSGVMAVGFCVPAYASGGDVGSLSDTLKVFSDVFAWFLKEGANLLSWMLDKPIILLSLSIFFVGAVVGMLSRIYGSF